MKIIRQLSEDRQQTLNRSVVSIGSYDGVHRGHKRIISNLRRAADAYNVLTALVTFYPRPKVVLAPHTREKNLTTVDEKLLIFENLGLDIVAILPFTYEFSQTPASRFIERLVAVLHPVELWVGPDFKLGKDRQGDISYLKQLGQEFDYQVKEVDLTVADDEIISSTRIRATLSAGQIREVTRLLGDTYFLLGVVVKGAQRGQDIGFPTANIATNGDKLLPPNGVYAVKIRVANKLYPAVANVGVRPTFNETEKTVEVHIFDFNRDIYGQEVKVEFVDYLRPEKKFDSLNSLISQIKKDIQRAQSVLGYYLNP